jgi:hypothetical protein
MNYRAKNIPQEANITLCVARYTECKPCANPTYDFSFYNYNVVVVVG